MIEQLLQAIASIKARLDRLEGKSYGGRWVDWTPTVTQSGAVTVTVTEAKYCLIGKVCHIYAKLAITGTGTGANAITVGATPVAAQPAVAAGEGMVHGQAWVQDAATANYYGLAVNSSAADWIFVDTNTRGYIGTNPNFALANTDKIFFSATYRVA